VQNAISDNNYSKFQEYLANLTLEINKCYGNYTILGYSVRKNKKAMVEHLLKLPRINVNATNSDGWSPIFYAVVHAKRSGTQIIKLLLKQLSCKPKTAMKC